MAIGHVTHKRSLIPASTRFGRLTVQALSENRTAAGNRIYICLCDCGQQTEVVGSNLTTAKRPTRSCGCLARETAERPIPKGMRVGRLTVQEPLQGVRRNGQIVYRCACDCGGVTDVRSRDLRRGTTRSCGCAKGKHTHDGSGHPLYGTWRGMHTRCYRPSHEAYHQYGGRGIIVCGRWHDPWAFFEDMGEKPGPEYTIDRINNDGNYEPENCRWATASEQRHNQRARQTNPPDPAKLCACGRPKGRKSKTCYDCRGTGRSRKRRMTGRCSACGGPTRKRRTKLCRSCWLASVSGAQRRDTGAEIVRALEEQAALPLPLGPQRGS